MSLAVICCHFNPGRFRAPRRNLTRFLWQMESMGIPVFVAELAYDSDPFFLSTLSEEFRFRTSSQNILWHKENLLNLLAERIPPKFTNLAWIDPDVYFMYPKWLSHAEHTLKKVGVVQLFSEAIWVDKEGRFYKKRAGAVASGALRVGETHPGFGWAARRELWKQGDGLCELAILGAGDALFASACLKCSPPSYIFYSKWKEWTARSATWIDEKNGCGFVPGTVIHEWHGAETNRAYETRHLLLRDIDINEIVEKRKDGLLEFKPDVSREVRQGILAYFMRRQEDEGCAEET